MTKKETVEEFLARGGKVTIVPPVAPSEDTHIMPTKTQVDFDIVSLGDAEYMFGESRTKKVKTIKKRVSDEDFKSMVDNSGLPASIIEALKSSMRK